MKPSHFHTPRSMDDATWHHSGQALHGFHRQDSWSIGDVLFAVILGSLAAAFLAHILAR